MRFAVRSLLALSLAAALSFSASADTPTAPASVADAPADSLRAKETFALVWARLQSSGFKGQHEGIDWASIKAAHQADIENAKNLPELRKEIEELLRALKASHLSLIPIDAFPKPGQAPKVGTGDLGLRLTVLDGRIAVERVIEDSPAARAGVQSGWTVHRIGEFDVDKALRAGGETLQPRGLVMLQMTVNRMVGAIVPGTELPLRLRDRDGREVGLSLTAQTDAKVQTIQLANLPPMPLRIEDRRIPLQGGGCALQVAFSQWAMPVYGRMIEALRAHGDCRGVVIDLRGNSGGLLASVGAVSGLFFDKPASLGTMITSGGDLQLKAMPREVDDEGRDVRRFSGPVAILIDRGSISCSDIFPAAMQAVGRARIFGETSAGMALPSVSVPLPSGDYLLYPTADYVDPKSRRIEGVGVAPDAPIVLSLEALRAGRDPALDAALAWIGGAQ